MLETLKTSRLAQVLAVISGFAAVSLGHSLVTGQGREEPPPTPREVAVTAYIDFLRDSDPVVLVNACGEYYSDPTLAAQMQWESFRGYRAGVLTIEDIHEVWTTVCGER